MRHLATAAWVMAENTGGERIFMPRRCDREKVPAAGARRVGWAWLVVGLCLVATPARGAENIDSPKYWRKAWDKLASRGRGFVVWESNRTGSYRIWYRNLDGSGLRQISPDEKGRWHYCAHLSPDGKKLVYMSFPADMWQDGWVSARPGKKRPMHLINVDGTGDRVIVPNARTYQEHRAAIWHGNDEVVYIDANGFTQKMNVKTGKKVALTRDGQDAFGWLINPTKTFATSRTIWITFSPYDAKTRTVTPTKIYGGCQGYFSRDGVWGFYVGGQGGPINRVHLATGKVSPIIKRNDPRMPKKRRYLYTPMLSSSGRLFAFGAAPRRASERSPGSDYDIFVAACNPKTLELIGKPARYTFHKSNDRFPDMFLAPKGPAATGQGAVAKAPAWPTNRRGLVFLWGPTARANAQFLRAHRKQRQYGLHTRGRAWIDHNYGPHFVGNGSLLIEKVGAILTAACKKTNALSIEVTLTPAANRQGRAAGRKVSPARIVTLCPKGKPDRAAFALAQAGNTLVFQLRTSGADGKTPAPAWTDLKCKLSAGKATQVVVTYGGDGLAAYVDGRKTVQAPRAGTFSNWSEGQLLLGGLDANREAWSGNLEGVAIFDRALGAAEALSDHGRYRAIRVARKVVPKFEVKAKFLAHAKIPTYEDVAPYPNAMVFCEYQTAPLPGDNQPPPTRFRAAKWVILDRRPVALDRKKGRTYTLILERLEDNPQLGCVPLRTDPLKEDLEDPNVPLYFETGR